MANLAPQRSATNHADREQRRPFFTTTDAELSTWCPEGATPPDPARRLPYHFGRRPYIIRSWQLPTTSVGASVPAPSFKRGPFRETPILLLQQDGASQRHVPQAQAQGPWPRHRQCAQNGHSGLPQCASVNEKADRDCFRGARAVKISVLACAGQGAATLKNAV